MRKIESLMLAAIKNRANWKSDNTAVEFLPAVLGSAFDRSHVTLHGNHIATVWHCDGKADRVEANWHTFQLWPSATTRSRLRALGIPASIQKGKACIDGMQLADY